MTTAQEVWARSHDRLVTAVSFLGFPEGLADLLAKQLRTPNSMDRMASYLYQARPKTVEMIVDEMLAICDDAENWREKAQSREAQAGYNAWLSSISRLESLEEDKE